jgi:hypothetical protein
MAFARLRRAILRSLLVSLAVLLVYAVAVRPWFLTWGATAEEARKTLAGDSVIPGAPSAATRAITIHAPPERVWPWIAQIGQGRGGFYSYTWLENLFGCRMVNAERIHPEWQDVKPGEGVRLHPSAPPIPVALAVRNRALVLGNPEATAQMPPVTWAFVLEPATGNSTRLLVRWRSKTPDTLSGRLLYKYLLEPIHFTMERRMMLGLRERAERQ